MTDLSVLHCWFHRDKVVLRMTREGAVEENLTAGTEQRVSKRLEDAELVKPGETVEPSEALSPEEQKKVQMRRQQRQFQAEHAEDNDTQPPSETSVREEKRAENPPQNVTEPLPSETPFKPPALEQHGVSSHTGTVIAETVVTHKLRKTSAVEAVDADAILTQAAETASAKPLSAEGLLSDSPFYGLVLICILVAISSRGEKLLFKISIGSLADNYDGMMLGFSLKKE